MSLATADLRIPLGSQTTPAAVTPTAKVSNRLTSIDAYRGLVMLLMMGEVLKLQAVSKALPGSGLWALLARHQEHVDWIGCVLHDLIQPSFSFLVGVALPFSLARRAGEGQPAWRRTLHAFWRAMILVLLGVFLRSTYSKQTNWTFEDTLSQIGLGYGFLYLLALRSARVQWIALGVILIGYWLAFAVYPLPGAGFDWARVGTTPDAVGQLHGFAGHWSKNTNVAWAFDNWFLNRFPRPKPFTHNNGGYSTLSFIPTLGTMILGLLAGGLLRSERPMYGKVGVLCMAGIMGLVAGWLLGWLGICPVVKKIWTPSWVLFAGGWSCLFLAGFYLVLDVWRQRWMAWPLVVVGMNSIAAYFIAHEIRGAIQQSLITHLGHKWYTFKGPAYEPLIIGAAVLLVEWLMLLWMYRRKIFLRV